MITTFRISDPNRAIGGSRHHIIAFIYTHSYLQAVMQVLSVRIWWNPGSFQRIPVPFFWNPAESCGILWNLVNGCIPAGICGASKSTAVDQCVVGKGRHPECWHGPVSLKV